MTLTSEHEEMPYSRDAKNAYYQANKTQVQAQRRARKLRTPATPEDQATQSWLRCLLARHTLTTQDLATLVGLRKRGVACWLLNPAAVTWERIPAKHRALITEVLPQAAPMRTETCAQLGWSTVRTSAYQQTFGQEMPVITRAILRTWRDTHQLTCQALARALSVSTYIVKEWCAPTNTHRPERMSAVNRRNLGWLMQQTKPLDTISSL